MVFYPIHCIQSLLIWIESIQCFFSIWPILNRARTQFSSIGILGECTYFHSAPSPTALNLSMCAFSQCAYLYSVHSENTLAKIRKWLTHSMPSSTTHNFNMRLSPMHNSPPRLLLQCLFSFRAFSYCHTGLIFIPRILLKFLLSLFEYNNKFAEC